MKTLAEPQLRRRYKRIASARYIKLAYKNVSRAPVFRIRACAEIQQHFCFVLLPWGTRVVLATGCRAGGTAPTEHKGVRLANILHAIQCLVRILEALHEILLAAGLFLCVHLRGSWGVSLIYIQTL
jgi:hypothetical protein